jgi:hypothetical protein
MSQLPSSLSEARALISNIRARAFARHAAIADPPEEPLRGDCCERGCDRCVFTVYYEAIDAWRRDIEQNWR